MNLQLRLLIIPAPGRRDARESDEADATLCGVYTPPTAAWHHQRYVSVQGPAIWTIANRLRSGFVQMGDIRSQEQGEVGCVMLSLGSTLRPWSCHVWLARPCDVARPAI